MGRSSSSVNSVSNTTYSNTPQTVQDNAMALSNSNLVTGQGNFSGSQANKTSITGSTFNSLDGGAIASAFGFGSDLVLGLFQAQKENNAMISANNTAALNFSSKAQELVDKKNNPESIQSASLTRNLIIAGLVAVAFFYFKKG